MVQQGKTVLAQLKATDLELALAEAEAELVKARETARKLKHGLRPEEIEEKRAEVQERKTWVEKYAKDLERAKSMRTRDIPASRNTTWRKVHTWRPKPSTNVPCSRCVWPRRDLARKTWR